MPSRVPTEPLPEYACKNDVATDSGGAQVALIGTTAFVAGAKGLASYTLTETEPERLHHVALEVGSPTFPTAGLAVASEPESHRVFVAGPNGVASFDVSQPHDIRIIAQVKNEVAVTNSVQSVRFPGGRLAVSNALYVASGVGIASYDLATLQWLGTLPNQDATVKGGAGVDAAGRLLCVAGMRGVTLYDSTDPRAPAMLSHVDAKDLDGSVTGCCLDAAGVRLIVSGKTVLAVYDVSQAVPRLLQKLQHTLSTGENGPRLSGTSLACLGSALYVAGADGLGHYQVATGSVMQERLCARAATCVGTFKAGVDVAVNEHRVVVAGAKGVAMLPRNSEWWPEEPRSDPCAKVANFCAGFPGIRALNCFH